MGGKVQQVDDDDLYQRTAANEGAEKAAWQLSSGAEAEAGEIGRATETAWHETTQVSAVNTEGESSDGPFSAERAWPLA